MPDQDESIASGKYVTTIALISLLVERLSLLDPAFDLKEAEAELHVRVAEYAQGDELKREVAQNAITFALRL